MSQEMVRVATETELKADETDHSHWMYRDVDRTAQGENVSMVVETPDGSISKKIEMNGHRLSDDGAPEGGCTHSGLRKRSGPAG